MSNAYSRITALLEDSDDESITQASPGKIASFFSSPPLKEQGKDVITTSYDIDLDDEEQIGAADMPESADMPDDDGEAAYARIKALLSKPATKAVDASRKVASIGENDTRKGQEVAKPIDASRKSSPIGEASEDSEDDMPVRKTISRRAPIEVLLESSPMGTASEDEMPFRKTKLAPRKSLASSLVRSSSPALPATRRSPSPTLFVSPAASRHSSPHSMDENSDQDSDELPDNAANPRLRELIAKKRAEREEKQRADRKAAQKARRDDAAKELRQAKQLKEIYSSEMDDGMTEEARQALTDASRPMRKAGKKALEEMNRETQRMARNQQLAHQAKVKRKITTADFLKSMGMAPMGSDEEPAERGALISSDTEGNASKETPPSSPPSRALSHDKLAMLPRREENEDEYIIGLELDSRGDEELPELQTWMTQPIQKLDKGKGIASEQAPALNPTVASKPVKKTSKQIRVIPPPKVADDSDDDLEIVPAKQPSCFAVFDRLPEKSASETRSMLQLRALAHVAVPETTSASRRGPSRPSLTPAQLDQKLKEQMYKQSAAEKQERLDDLKKRGIVIETEEEREQQQMFIENALERAREDAMQLAKKEKATADKDGVNIDENYALPSDDESEDGDWADEEEREEEVVVDGELSGSEEEDADDEEDSGQVLGSLVDDAAEEDDAAEDEDAIPDDGREEAEFAMLADQDEEESSAPVKPRAKPRNRQIIMDDDDDEEEPQASVASASTSVKKTQASQINAFGFDVPQSSLSLTQMFKGTMADIDSQMQPTQDDEPGGSLEFLRNAAVPSMPFESPLNPTQPFLVQDSQSVLATPSKPAYVADMTPGFTPTLPTQFAIGSQMTPTKQSEIPDPTQDVGFESFRAPTQHIEEFQSTIETVMAPIVDSPVQPKRGKLQRRVRKVAILSDDEGNSADGEGDDADEPFELTTTAFDALFKANKKVPVVETFDKKNSRAKNMVEDQAEESEDEYAGIGGASDDESNGEMDEEMKKLIDEGPVDVDEGELAKFFIEKEREANEKGVDKLYRDITTGGLRRKRGAGVDELSDDSDDEAMERRRQKQREFAKMRRALLEDENVGKIGEFSSLLKDSKAYTNPLHSRQPKETRFPPRNRRPR